MSSVCQNILPPALAAAPFSSPPVFVLDASNVMGGWRNTVGSLIEIVWLNKDLSRASIYWCTREKQRGTVSSNSRFQTVLAAISTVCRQSLSRAGLRHTTGFLRDVSDASKTKQRRAAFLASPRLALGAGNRRASLSASADVSDRCFSV